MRRIATLTLALAVWPVLAWGQGVSTASPTLTYGVKTLSFDRWCQDDQRYPASRCDARLPDDVTAFEDYRSSVERYDLQYEKDRTKEHEFERDMLRHDHSQPQPMPDVIAPAPQ